MAKQPSSGSGCGSAVLTFAAIGAIITILGLLFGMPTKTQRQSQSPLATVNSRDINLSGAGDCRSERANVDMLAVVFLPGGTATTSDGSTRLRVSFTYDRVDIGELDRPERGTRWFEVTRLVGADSDVRLQFARVNGSIMLYWRETAEHGGTYKQGLLSIRTDQLTPVCRGTGGIWRVLH